MKILITGASGLLGGNLAFLYGSRYSVAASYFRHPVNIAGCEMINLDVLDQKAVQTVINASKPQVIIHCAANANVDDCETNQEQAYQLNVLATRYLASCAKEAGCKFVYLSTDSVFTNNRSAPFREDEARTPKTVYAKTKVEGEDAILSSLPDALVLRTCIYGYNILEKFSLGEWILHKLSQHQTINGFSDVFFTPILVNDFAVRLEIALKSNLSGIYHFASRNSVSKFDFARMIAQRFGFETNLVRESSIEGSGLQAIRPLRPCLDVSKFELHLRAKFPTVEEGIDHFYELYKQDYPKKLKLFGKTDAVCNGAGFVEK